MSRHGRRLAEVDLDETQLVCKRKKCNCVDTEEDECTCVFVDGACSNCGAIPVRINISTGERVR